MKTLKKVSYRLLILFAWCSVLTFFCWSIGALYYFLLVPFPLRVLLAFAYVAGVVYLWRTTPNKSHWLSKIAFSIIVIYLLTLLQRPINDRDWVAEQSRLPRVTVDENQITIKNFRQNEYRTEQDFDVRYRDFEFDLDQIESVWFNVQKFTVLEGLAHTFVCFGLKNNEPDDYFGVSVEIRREKGETYSPIRGLYRQYELAYVVGHESDLVVMRTKIRRKDRIHMYRVNATPKQAQQLFMDIAGGMNRLAEKPQFYHTLLANCTNTIVRHTYKLTPEPINWMDPRIVVPGFSDRFAYANGLIGNEGETFTELRHKCRIDKIAQVVSDSENFSKAIRQPQLEN